MIVWCGVEDCKHRDAEHGMCGKEQIWITEEYGPCGFNTACSDYEEKEMDGCGNNG